jgi:hypothetical protein
VSGAGGDGRKAGLFGNGGNAGATAICPFDALSHSGGKGGDAQLAGNGAGGNGGVPGISQPGPGGTGGILFGEDGARGLVRT